jgi:hypothetical protein
VQEELHDIGLAFIETDFAEDVIQLPQAPEALIETLRGDGLALGQEGVVPAAQVSA